MFGISGAVCVGVQAALMAKMKAVQAAFETASGPPAPAAGDISPMRDASPASDQAPSQVAEEPNKHECVLCSGDSPGTDTGPLGLVVSPADCKLL